MQDRIKLLYGTGNPSKLASMRRGLAKLNLEILGLDDMSAPPPEVEENGATPLENAAQKAKAYFEFYRVPVFSCDSGLYFDGLPPEEQPGIHVRNVGGKRLTDSEMVEHYAALARRHGNLTARYVNAVCLVLDRDRVFSAMDDSLASAPFIITGEPHHSPIRAGFPLDSLSIDIASGKYYYDIPGYMVDSSVIEKGCAGFFCRVLNINQQ